MATAPATDVCVWESFGDGFVRIARWKSVRETLTESKPKIGKHPERRTILW
jgi:hypothetical protein